jgi:hypothetical protein
VFITSTTHYGNLPGIGAADFFRNVRASAAGLTGNFKAWISDSPATAPNVTFTRPTVDYVLPDMTVVAHGWTGLTTTDLLHPINLDENGVSVNQSPIEIEVSTYTATDRTGAHVTFSSTEGPVPADCDDWLDANPKGALAGTGDANKIDGRWSFQGFGFDVGPGIGIGGSIELSCGAERHLYCFEQ